MNWRATTTHGLGAVLLGLLSACGGNTISEIAPAQPSPIAPSPTSAGFLHVRTAPEVTTYKIDAQTGRLQETARQNLGPTVDAMSGEPRGRFVYLAYNPLDRRPPFGEPRPSIVAFASSPQDGALTAVSEEWSSAPRLCSQAGTRWVRLTAAANRVYALWENTCLTSSPIDDIYVTHSVTDDGQLGPAQEYPFQEGGREGLFDAGSGLFYSTRTSYGTTALIAHAIGPDGSLTQTGGSNLCLAADILTSRPLVGVRGFVFARSYGWSYPSGEQTQTTCLWEGARLAPRADLGFVADLAEAYVPNDPTLPAQIVFPIQIPARSGQPVRYELRLFALRPDGDFRLQDTIQSVDATTQLLFHPSGRFLYANAGSTLQVFSVGPEGRLALVQMLDGASGFMAVTTPR